MLFRLNLLVVTLCFVMNRQYQFYYYVPLVSFWFMVIYITMAVWPQASEKIAEGKFSLFYHRKQKFNGANMGAVWMDLDPLVGLFAFTQSYGPK